MRKSIVFQMGLLAGGASGLSAVLLYVYNMFYAQVFSDKASAFTYLHIQACVAALLLILSLAVALLAALGVVSLIGRQFFAKRPGRLP